MVFLAEDGLRYLLSVVFDETVGSIDNIACTAVVLFEFEELCSRYLTP